MKSLRFLGSEVFLGTLIALLSILTALASWQSSVADSNQSAFELKAMENLNNGNAEYISANQYIIYDYNMYDGWYTADDPELAEYYQSSYTQELQDALAVNPEDPFSDEYYDTMFAEAYAYWEEFESNMQIAAQWNQRGDELQMVMLIMAVGLAFVAWASLLGPESRMRMLFSIMALLTLIGGVIMIMAWTKSHTFFY